MKRFMMILALFSAALCVNPGFIAQVNFTALEQLKYSFIPIINKEIKEVDLNDPIDLGELKINRVHASIDPFTPEEFKIEGADNNVMKMSLTNIAFHIDTDVEVKKSFFHDSGSIKMTGKVDRVDISVISNPYNEADPRPYCTVQINNISVNPDNWDFNLDIKYIPDFIANFIMSIVKKTALKSIIDQVSATAVKSANELVTKTIADYYPLAIDTEYDTSLSTKLTGMLSFADMSAFVPVDGTFYDTKAGYSHKDNPDPIITKLSDQCTVDMFLTEYTVNTLFNSLFNKDIEFSYKSLSFKVITEDDKKVVSFKNNNIILDKFSLTFRGEVQGIFVEANTVTSAELFIKSTDASQKTIELGINNLNFDEFELKSSFPFVDKSASIIKSLIYLALKLKNSVKVKIPTFYLPFDIDLTGIEATINEENMRFGVRFDVDTVNKLLLSYNGMMKAEKSLL